VSHDSINQGVEERVLERVREIEKGKRKINVDIRLLKFVKNLLADRDKVEEVEYLPGEQS
jgi:7,8-dihydro-6-hydroxymethylpterin-pyrophosphokinase